MDKIFTGSRRVLARDFDQQWLKDRAREMCLEPDRKHRKIWEFAAIAQVFLDSYGGEGEKCLGFGCGKEPIPSWLAKFGCSVVASDAPLTDAIDRIWSVSSQHSANPDDLFFASIISRQAFDWSVNYKAVDMNNISEFLLNGSFGFTWSCGSFEHIGGIDASLNFFCNQMKALKPGGIAAHTTEYNFGSNDETINAKDLVLFRKQDLEHLDEMLKAQGDRLLPLDLRGGDLPEDKIIDDPPYVNPVHLALRINQIHVSTSIILIAQRGQN